MRLQVPKSIVVVLCCGTDIARPCAATGIKTSRPLLTTKKPKARLNMIAAELYVAYFRPLLLAYSLVSQLFERDPVRTTQLVPFVAARYAEAKAVCGGEETFKKTYLVAFAEVEANRADKGHRALPANLDVLYEIEGYLSPTPSPSIHQ